MKRFIFSVLCISVFFIGLGSIVERVGARFKSDEKALVLIKAARTAIGGDSAIAGVQSLRIKGNSVHTFKADGSERSEPGETEIALQLPDKLSRMVKIGGPENGEAPSSQIVNRHVETVVVGGTDENGNVRFGRGEGNGTGVGAEPGTKVVILKKGDGDASEVKTEAGQAIIVRKGEGDALSAKVESGDIRVKVNREEMEARHKTMQQNELFRLTLGLLLSPPAGIEASYKFGGETEVEGTPCNLVVAEFAGSSVKLYLNKGSNLPVMIAYTGEAMPVMVTFNKEVPTPGDGDKNVMFFRHADGPDATAEFQLRFSDYRGVGDLQLPYHWTTIGGGMREEMDVTSYEVNPADIANSFQNQKMTLRVKKEGQ
jgi:hypothetical protein